MKITLECDSLSDNGSHGKYIAITNGVIQRLIDNGEIDKQLTIVGNMHNVVQAFFANGVDVYIDSVRFCSDCRKKCANKIHCYSCNKCKSSDKFCDNDDCLLKTCDTCREKIYQHVAPARGYGMVGGYYTSSVYTFKLPTSGKDYNFVDEK